MTYERQTRAPSSRGSSTRSKPKSSARTEQRNGFQPRDLTGTLFYDAPNVPTLSGTLSCRGIHEVTGEPEIDRQQRNYMKIVGSRISGALYDNDRKTEDRHPDYTGPLEVNGVKFRMSAWRKQIQKGQNAGSDFLSVAISLVEPKADRD